MSRNHPPWFLFWHSAGLTAAVAIAMVLGVLFAIRYWPPLAAQIEAWFRG